MKKYIFKEKFWLATTVFFRAFGASMLVVVSLLLQRIVDDAMSGNLDEFINTLIFSIIFFIVMFINDYLNKTTQFIYLKKTLTNLKEDVFKGILRKDYKNFNSENTADYISKLTNDINMVETKFIVPYLEMIGDVVIFVGTVGVLVWINVWLTLAIFLISALIFIVPSLFGKPIAKRQDAVSKELSVFTTKIKDIFQGYEVIKSYNIEANMTDEFLENNRKVEDVKFKSNHIQGISGSLSMFLGIMAQTSGIAMGGFLLIQGTFTVGTLMAVMQLSNGLYGPIMWIVSKLTTVKGMKEVNENLIKIAESNKKIESKDIVESFSDEIELKDIEFAYEEEKTILNKVSIKFEKSKKYAIVGRSGCGKSTLFKLLLGYYDDFSGNILFDGKNYSNLDKDSINNQMSIIHQNVYMFDKNLKDNILLGKDFSLEELEIALKNSGAKEFIDKMPDGLNSSVGENGNNLSGGQRQRLAIARSIIQNTPILLLDEGTSALDSKTAFEIEDIILSLNDLTVITITHKLDENMLNRYDEIIVMSEGDIVEKGSFNELLDNKGEFYSLYNLS